MTVDDDSDDFINTAARFLAGQPGAAERTVAKHRRAPDGRCTGCGPATRWPCTLATIANSALAHGDASIAATPTFGLREHGDDRQIEQLIVARFRV